MSDTFSIHGEIALLGIGSNLGDRDAALRAAIDAIRNTPRIDLIATSTFIETEPVGNTDQPLFLNGAIKLRTTLSPRELLDRCLRVESDLGRVRSPTRRWGARTIDIDLLLFGERLIDENGLRVPHPRLHERFFALKPASEIADDMRHPILKKTMGELLNSLESCGFDR